MKKQTLYEFKDGDMTAEWDGETATFFDKNNQLVMDINESNPRTIASLAGLLNQIADTAVMNHVRELTGNFTQYPDELLISSIDAKGSKVL